MCLQMVQLIQENNEADYANTTDKLDETGSSVLSMWLKILNTWEYWKKILLYPSLLFFWIHQHIPDIYNMNSIR